VRLFRYEDPDEGPALGFLDGERVIPLPAWSITSELLEDPDLARLRHQAALLAGAAGVAPGALRPLPAADPGKVVCVGLNYGEHLAEQGREAPGRPVLFAKFPNAVIASGEPIVRPPGTRALDLEVELGVVIGRAARRARREDAMRHVAGYVVLNDVTARDWQGNKAALLEGETGDGQWLRAKGSDTFLPIGPDFVTADEVPDPGQLRLRSWRIPAGGPEAGRAVKMQDGSTADMIRSIGELIEFISSAITLDPGDVIATGTPSGVGVFRDPPVFLADGDRVRCAIEGIGVVENAVVDSLPQGTLGW